ncbi:hypothetical protein DFH27DRAFT_651446 [Peziza echinospora]|nr:hypothetical protein DFH27DRAFT_651446 [Peziza echinospora]
MVLHNDKWDRKAKKTYERKLRAKGAAAAADGAAAAGAASPAAAAGGATKKRGKVVGKGSAVKATAAGVKPAGAPKVKDEEEDESDDDEEEEEEEDEDSDDDDDDDDEGGVATATAPAPAGVWKFKPVKAEKVVTEEKEESSQDEEEEKPRGKFSKRKIVSNAWRFEEPEEEDPYLKKAREAEQAEAEPEPDYAAMTLSRPSQLAALDPDNAVDDGGGTADLDAFLGKTAPAKGGRPAVQYVDRKDFKEINEKIEKQQAADAFRARFASRKGGGVGKVDERGVGGRGFGPGTTDDDDNIDLFLAGLKVEDGGGKIVQQKPPPPFKAVSSSTGSSAAQSSSPATPRTGGGGSNTNTNLARDAATIGDFDDIDSFLGAASPPPPRVSTVVQSGEDDWLDAMLGGGGGGGGCFLLLGEGGERYRRCFRLDVDTYEIGV